MKSHIFNWGKILPRSKRQCTTFLLKKRFPGLIVFPHSSFVFSNPLKNDKSRFYCISRKKRDLNTFQQQAFHSYWTPTYTNFYTSLMTEEKAAAEQIHNKDCINQSCSSWKILSVSVHVSQDQNARQSHNIKIDNSSSERVEQFKYLRTTLTNQNSIKEEIKRRLMSGNSCYHSVQNLLSSSLLTKTLKINL